MKAPGVEAPRGTNPLAGRLIVAAGFGAACLLGAAQWLVLPAASVELLYFLVVVFVAWKAGVRGSGALTLACAGLIILDEWQSAPPATAWSAVFCWNVLTRVTLFCLAAWAIARLFGLTRDLRNSLDTRAAVYRAMLGTTMDGFARVDGADQLSEVNDAFCRQLGYERTELAGTKLDQIEMKESLQELQRHLARIRAAGTDRFETRLRHKDGHAVDMEISVSVLPGGNGALMAFTREIGERKRSEARLRESEERYRTLAESTPDAIFIVDREVRIQYANSAGAASWGKAAEDLVGLSQEALFDPETAREHIAVASRVFETGETARIDERMTFANGERWFEARLVPVRGADGQVRSLIVIAVDISERKRTEALLESQRDLALRLSVTSDLTTALNALLEVGANLEGLDCGGVYLCDPRNGDLTLAAHKGVFNTEFIKHVTRYPADSERARLVRTGRPVYVRFSELPVAVEGAGERLRAIAVLPLRHEDTIVGALNLASHTRDSIPPQTCTVIETLAAQTAGAIARVRAETDRHRLEQQILEISDREQARIGQELHDGLCQQLVSLAFDANALEAELSRAKRSEAAVAARISRYLDQAITESRQLSRGLFPVRLEAEGLPSALQELAHTTEARFGVACSVDCEEALPLRNGTMAVHLYRITQEAVTNALKHGRARDIRIRLGQKRQELELEIQDDGSGFSGDAAGRGGMGLHIMDYRARSIGGKLQFSRRPEGGTRVSCCIPSGELEQFDI